MRKVTPEIELCIKKIFTDNENEKITLLFVQKEIYEQTGVLLSRNSISKKIKELIGKVIKAGRKSALKPHEKETIKEYVKNNLHKSMAEIYRECKHNNIFNMSYHAFYTMLKSMGVSKAYNINS